MTSKIREFASACDMMLYRSCELEHARIALDNKEPDAFRKYFEAATTLVTAERDYTRLRFEIQDLVEALDA